jgi:hypothetical protein
VEEGAQGPGEESCRQIDSMPESVEMAKQEILTELSLSQYDVSATSMLRC